MGFLLYCPNKCEFDTKTSAGILKVSVYVDKYTDEIIVCPKCNRVLYKPKVKLTEENYDDITGGKEFYD